MLRKLHAGVIENEDDPDEMKFDTQKEVTLSNYAKYGEQYVPK